ncbi:MAG: DsbA family protein [Nitrospirales bacterium]
MSDQSIRSLVYVTDPMCSWCWGFSPVIEAVRERYQGRCAVKLLVGGLRPGNTERFDAHRRNTILGHWRSVHDRTGQPFNFEFQMGSDFTYDTEPAARAIFVMRQLEPSQAFSYLKAVHEAFYVENKDVTQLAVLTDLAIRHGVDQEQFVRLFHDSETKKEIWKEFDQVRELGVSGFPTLLALNGEEFITLTHGYQSINVLVPLIETWLNSTGSN